MPGTVVWKEKKRGIIQRGKVDLTSKGGTTSKKKRGLVDKLVNDQK